jgi:hypothetical protein
MPSTERSNQIAFAERQFEIYKLRAQLNHALSIENPTARAHFLMVMGNFIRLMAECNETLDGLRRCR